MVRTEQAYLPRQRLARIRPREGLPEGSKAGSWWERLFLLIELFLEYLSEYRPRFPDKAKSSRKLLARYPKDQGLPVIPFFYLIISCGDSSPSPTNQANSPNTTADHNPSWPKQHQDGRVTSASKYKHHKLIKQFLPYSLRASPQ